MTELPAAMSRFSNNVSELLRRIKYELAQTPEERAAIFKLRYDANLREQSIAANPEQVLIDRYDDSENAFNIAVFLNDELAAALRLHLLWEGFPDSPLLAAYPDLVRPRVDAGLRIVDITRLAADFTIARSEPNLAYATVRLSMLICEHFDADIILAAVRREHIPFYRREFLATQLSEARPYPTLIKPLCLFEINYKAHKEAIIARHPFHASSDSERSSLFGPSSQWPMLKSAAHFAHPA